jgi:hypothetical protein
MVECSNARTTIGVNPNQYRELIPQMNWTKSTCNETGCRIKGHTQPCFFITGFRDPQASVVGGATLSSQMKRHYVKIKGNNFNHVIKKCLSILVFKTGHLLCPWYSSSCESSGVTDVYSISWYNHYHNNRPAILVLGGVSKTRQKFAGY